MAIYDDADEAGERDEPPAKAKRKGKPKPMRGAAVLKALDIEFQNCIGLDNSDELTEDRTKALEYINGEMNDVPTVGNRSKSISTDIRDAVDTAMPDLMDIFMGGEDIGAFRANGEEDYKAAQQETQVVNQIILENNTGFITVHDAIYDALTQKLGVIYVWGEDADASAEETVKAVTMADIGIAFQSSQIVNVAPAQMQRNEDGEDLFDVTFRRNEGEKLTRTAAVKPENFGHSRDVTGSLRDATYCVMKMEARAQDLKARGFDPDKIDKLGAKDASASDDVSRAADQANESDEPPPEHDKESDLRTVEILIHSLRHDCGDGKGIGTWQYVTDAERKILIDKQRLNCVPFAAGTPYRIPHRAVGRSLADLLIEIQRIKTVLIRASLDQALFALNARQVVNTSKAGDYTIADLLRNEPGMPVRVTGDNAVTPLMSAPLSFDPYNALEYFSTAGEQRSGIVRNAQGLNPDTLHDTKGGAQMLIAAAQKRLRMVARTLAETLFRDLFLIVHMMARASGSHQIAVRINGKYQSVDPTSWGSRSDMVIEIGTGAGGRDADIMNLGMLMASMEKVLEGQATGALDKPVIFSQNVYHAFTRFAERLGFKQPELFATDPSQTEAPQPQQDPKVALEQQKAMQEAQAAERSDAIKAAEIQGKQSTADNEQAFRMAELEDKRALAVMEHERAMQELAMRGRELDIKEQELQIKAVELIVYEELERTKIADSAWQSDRDNEFKASDGERADKSEARADSETRTKAAGGVDPESDTAKLLKQLTASMAAKRVVVRDKDGRITGVDFAKGKDDG